MGAGEIRARPWKRTMAKPACLGLLLAACLSLRVVRAVAFVSSPLFAGWNGNQPSSFFPSSSLSPPSSTELRMSIAGRNFWKRVRAKDKKQYEKVGDGVIAASLAAAQEKPARRRGMFRREPRVRKEGQPEGSKVTNFFLRRAPPRKIALMIEPTPFTHISGYANRFRYLLQNLAKAGDDVHIVTTDDKAGAPKRFLRFPIINTTGFRFPLYNHICLTFDHDMKGWGLLERMRPEILHVTSPGFITFAAMIYARIFRVPLVFSYHTHLPMYAKTYAGWIPGVDWLSFKVIKFVHNRADLTLVTSPQMQDELVEWGIERVDVWRKGIDTDKFNPRFKSAEMRNRLSDGNPDAPLLIYVGRMGAEKRLRDIRDVMDRLPGVRAALVGGGPDLPHLKKYFAGRDVVFTGPLSGDELSQAFASADIFLMPSDTETLGFVVLESMASGVPVIASKAGGIPDLINEGITGYLCEPGNADVFAARAKELFDDVSKYEKMRAEARSETEKHSWEAATAYLRNVQYQKAIVNYRFRALDGLGLPHTRSKARQIVVRARDTFIHLARSVAPFLPPCNVAGETPFPMVCKPIW